MAREKTALVGPAETVTASAVSTISGRYAPGSGAAGAKHFACSPESATWLRATAQPFFAQMVSSLVRNSTSTNSSAPGAVRDIASESPGIVKRQRESGSRAGGTNAPTSTTAPSARSRQRPSKASARVKQLRFQSSITTARGLSDARCERVTTRLR